MKLTGKSEIAGVLTPAEALAKMLDAKTVSLYLGPVQYPVVGKGQLEAIKELAQLLAPATAAPTK